MNTIEFGNFLRELRKNKGYKLRELARIVDCSATYLSRIENGHEKTVASEELLRKIALILQCDFDDLMFRARKIPKDLIRLIFETQSDFGLIKEICGVKDPVPVNNQTNC